MNSNTTSTVFLGIDVHKRTYSVTAVSENIVIKRASMPADPYALLAFIQKYFSDAIVYSVYEAGFSGFGLHRFLVSNNVHNIVVHAASIETEARNRSKTDKRDSKKMAFQLFHGKLKCVHIPSPQREFWRTVTRLRTQFTKDRARISCRIKSLLFYYSILPFNHKGRTSRKWILSLLTLQEVNVDVFYCIQQLVYAWLNCDDSIKRIDKRLKEQAKNDSKINDIYRFSHGIGLTSSRILANELGDLSQFHSQKALYCFIGLTPIEQSSGDKRQLGNITRQGNPIIRAILTEAAWTAIKKDKELEQIFDRLVRNTGSRKKAIVGIAKKMIGRTRTHFQKGNKFLKINPYKIEAICTS